MDRSDHRVPIVWSERYEVDIGPHVFPTAKYRLVKERLVAEGTITEADILDPTSASEEDVALVHSEEYRRKIGEDLLTPQERAILEVPLSDGLIQASYLCAGGSILTGRKALERGIAVHLGGGFHHAFRDHGEGFCLLNDVAIATMALLEDESIRRASVVDLDVHQGNGTAAIFADEPRVFTLSLHQQWNYPGYKPPSDLDVGLEDGIRDDAYLRKLGDALPMALAGHRPELVFYLAGADPYREDQLGGLALTMDGLRARDDMVIEAARSVGAAVAVVLAGGYAHREADTVEIHCETVRSSVEAARREPG